MGGAVAEHTEPALRAPVAAVVSIRAVGACAVESEADISLPATSLQRHAESTNATTSKQLKRIAWRPSVGTRS